MAKFVIKNKPEVVEAWRLGDCSSKETELMKSNMIVRFGDLFEVHSQEYKEYGEPVMIGDYFKIDKAGYPYPIDKEYFLKTHRHIEGNRWEEFPEPIMAWESADAISPEVRFLMENKGLEIDPEHPDQFFKEKMNQDIYIAATATTLIIFNSVSYDNDGNVINANFEFLSRAEFERDYRYYE